MYSKSIILLALLSVVGQSYAQAVQCTPVDDDGTPLTGSGRREGSFVTCTYAGAGPCTYFPVDGSFSSGSSQCPEGVPQGQNPPTTAAPAPTTTTAPPTVVPLPTTSSTSVVVAPPPVTTTTSTTPLPLPTTTSTTSSTLTRITTSSSASSTLATTGTTTTSSAPLNPTNAASQTYGGHTLMLGFAGVAVALHWM